MRRWLPILRLAAALALVVLVVALDPPAAVLAEDVIVVDPDKTLPRDSPIEVWHGLVALAIPYVVGLIIRRGWPKGKQNLALVGVAAAVAIVGEYVQGGWGDVLSADPMMTLLKVVTLTKVAYSTIYQAVPLPQLVEAKTGGDPFKEQDPYKGMAA